MKPYEYIEDKPKKQFEWGYLYKVYIVVLIAVFILACANMADAGVIFNNDYYEDPYLEMSDILDNETNYTAFKNGVEHTWGVTLPSWSDTTAIDDFTENVLMYFVGNYANLSATVVGQVSDAISDVTDILDLVSFNLETGDFVATPNREGDLSNVIHGVVDPLIYDEPVVSGPVVGNWYEVPHNYNGYYVYSSNPNIYTCIVQSGSYSYILTASFDYNADFAVGQGTYQNLLFPQYGNCNNTYNGSYVVGYFSTLTYASAPPSTMGASAYATRNAALADLFGQDWTRPSDDPVLNGNGYIINDNPTYPPLGIYPSATLDIPQLIVDGHTSTTDPEDPVGLPSGVNTVEPNPKYTDVPTWLVDPTVDIPEEPDYLENVDVELPEIEPDTGFITDCYNALPSGIVSMIAVGLGLGVVMKIIS